MKARLTKEHPLLKGKNALNEDLDECPVCDSVIMQLGLNAICGHCAFSEIELLRKIVADRDAIIAEMREALQPLAKVGELLIPSIEDNDGIWHENNSGKITKLTAGDARRATAILAKYPQVKK